MPNFPLANQNLDKPGDFISFPDGSRGECVALDARWGGGICYVALRPGDQHYKRLETVRASLSTDDPASLLIAKWDREDALEAQQNRARLAEPPDPEILRRRLLSHFSKHRLGGMVCRPLNRWHRQGQAFLCGYVSVSDAPHCERPSGYKLILRRGAFRDVLARKSSVEAWVEHHGDLCCASTMAGSLALVEDEYGLLAFVDPTGWRHGEALAHAVAKGELAAMSFFHQPGKTDNFEQGRVSYIESLSVAALPEVSFVAAGANSSAMAIAVNASTRYGQLGGEQCEYQNLLHLAERERV